MSPIARTKRPTAARTPPGDISGAGAAGAGGAVVGPAARYIRPEPTQHTTGGRHRVGSGARTRASITAGEPRTGPGPGPLPRPVRPERPERGVWVAAAAICAGLLLLPAGSALEHASAAPHPASTAAAGLPPGTEVTTTSEPGPLADPVVPGSGAAAGLQFAPAAVSAAMTAALPDQRARVAVDVAMKQIGLPYVWGGNGPENGHRGFDCSGLTTFAYDKAGIDLPRTAHTQFRHGPRLPDTTPLQPGDLVFYGTVKKVHHVGMYIGAGRMVNAPTFGKPVQTAWYRYPGDDYLGATRPAATGTGALPTTPDPAVPERPDPTIPDLTEFPAPPAPPLPPATSSAPAPLPQQPTTAIAMPAPPSSPTLAPTPVPVPGPLPEGRPDTGKPPQTTQPSAPSARPPRPTPPTPTPTPVPPRPTPPITTPPTPTPTPAPPTKPVTPPTTPPSPAVVQAVSLTDATGHTHPATPVTTDANGLPTSSGSWAGPGRWIVRLTAPLTGAKPETTLVLHLADGTTRTFTVTTTRTTTTATAPSSRTPLTVLSSAGAAEWVVTTAR